jgi:hypothetical protein
MLTEYNVRGKEKRLILLSQNFKTRKIKPLFTVMDSVKIYDVQMISKTKLIVTTMHCGVKVYLIDLKKRTQYEIKWFSETTKIRLLPGFDY